MEETWTKKELNSFRTMIKDKRESVIIELDEARERAESFTTGDSVNAIYSSHMADAGSDQQEREKLFYFLKRETEFLKYLDRALEMMDEGTFGICKTCKKKIAEERLIEVPHTTQCFSCKSKVKF
ncbi:MAG: transcriptional regulator [Candidatus Marinimicrobia bacterium]|nr:transcriptional regulator [Candidatus Neomarinimicrobiota bacterium]|tara:strand:- start:5052 stop:5426 length:375 start_codon:yes stop_codon:yes gene_type:complete